MVQLWEAIFPEAAVAEGLVAIAGRYTVPAGPVLAYRGMALPEVLHHALPERQIEFLAGRHCAAAALAALGLPRILLPIGTHGAPAWPASVTGSISHSRGLVMCVAGFRTASLGLGIDIEHIVAEAEARRLARDVATKPEYDAVIPHHDTFSAAFTVLFSAKEAIYKAVHCSVRRIVEFHEVVCTSATSSVLTFEPRAALARELVLHNRITVAVERHADHVVTLCRRATPDCQRGVE